MVYPVLLNSTNLYGYDLGNEAEISSFLPLITVNKTGISSSQLKAYHNIAIVFSSSFAWNSRDANFGESHKNKTLLSKTETVLR